MRKTPYNADGILEGETDYRHIEDKLTRDDAVSRDQWARMTAFILLRSFPPSVARKIARDGFQKFYAIAEPHLKNQDLKPDDYQRIYHWICDAVAKGQQPVTPAARVH